MDENEAKIRHFRITFPKCGLEKNNMATLTPPHIIFGGAPLQNPPGRGGENYPPGGRGGLVVRSRAGGLQVRNPIPPKNRRVSGPGARYIRPGQMSSRSCGAEAWRRVPDQVSSSSSDRGSKLRGPSQNSLHVAAKRGRK
ncbi:hypothetical protein AVEN_85906-1 [Araneus ventricosus]|uniref:Uncharacterized protein n=1 Tax=Araneus ventricosus TaxID=182803 RepID=A0A4Y2LMQ8_ARAVE|nr:hypothetical protein AVEN_85906-1 [Araneus ventricosus]